jgi:hypothetical protein
VIDPIVSEIALSQLVRRFAPFHGDTITPFIIGTVERDRRRNQDWTDALVKMVTAADVPAAEANLNVLQGWTDKWIPLALDAVTSLAPIFERPPLSVVSFDDALSEALKSHAEHLEALGLTADIRVFP